MEMTTIRQIARQGCLLVTLLVSTAAVAAGQTPATVQTVNRVQVLSHPSADGAVVVTVEPKTVLEVLDRDGQWVWVALSPDASGARRRGWVRTNDVEAAAPAGGAAPRPSSSTSTIPPSGDEIRRAKVQREQEARIEQARQNLERTREEYEAIVRGDPVPPLVDTPAPLPIVRSQQPSRTTLDLFGGYSLLLDDSDGITFPVGWLGSAGRQFTDVLSVVGEASGSYTNSSLQGLTLTSAQVYTFTAGPRLSTPTNGVGFYGQLLGGVAVISGSVLGVSASSVGFVLEPGFGMDIPIARSLGVRLGGELPIVRDSGGWSSGFRLMTGLVLRSGNQ